MNLPYDCIPCQQPEVPSKSINLTYEERHGYDSFTKATLVGAPATLLVSQIS